MTPNSFKLLLNITVDELKNSLSNELLRELTRYPNVKYLDCYITGRAINTHCLYAYDHNRERSEIKDIVLRTILDKYFHNIDIDIIAYIFGIEHYHRRLTIVLENGKIEYRALS